MTKRLVAAVGLALLLTACNDQYAGSTRSLSPIPPKTMALMAEKGMSKSDPILVRAYKKESELEVWKKGNDGRYALLKTFPICRWSGQLGPKRREGDRQAPEGFYTVTQAQMNPNSAYYLSFDTGYPNAYDRAHGGTGSALMVHGTCSSRGCFAMTDEGIAEVYAIAREAFSSGQRGFQFQSYPFKMTAENLARHRYDQNMSFWKNLKEGADYFEVTGDEPKVSVCGGRYAFNTEACKPADAAVATAVAQKERDDEQQVADLVRKGVPAVKIVYEDGGGHASFRETMMASNGGDSGFALLDARPRRNLGDVSRPDALAMGPREIPVDASGRPIQDKPAAALAFAGAAQPAATSSLRSTGPVATGSATPDASPARAAVAETGAAAGSSSAAPARSLYDRTLGAVFGEEKTAAPAAAPAEIVASQTGEKTPLPPRRGASLTGVKDKPADADRRAALGQNAPAAWMSWLSR